MQENINPANAGSSSDTPFATLAAGRHALGESAYGKQPAKPDSVRNGGRSLFAGLSAFVPAFQPPARQESGA